MNDLIGNNYEPTQEQLNAKKWMKIIGVILVLLLIISIALVVLIYYFEATRLKISLDGVETNGLKNVLIINDGKLYVPIRDFAKYVGYESSNGDYQLDRYTEDTTNCYVKCADEAATFSLDSNKIYKTLLDGENDYEYFEIDEPIKMINNKLCTTITGAQIAFNIAMQYNVEENQVTIYTLPKLVESVTANFKNSGISDDKAVFANKKALLYQMVVVKNAENYYGVSDLKGNEILGTKYTSIKFIESTKEFIVKTPERKMGIVAHDATTKISPTYDEIKQIDKDAQLYLVTNNKKQGVINNSGKTIVYLEYDQIGIDASKYPTNAIKNQYLLYDKCIPVKKGNKWGIFDKDGRTILEVEYDELGCTESVVTTTGEKRGNYNSVLLIPQYEGIVVKENGLYGLKNVKGEQLLPSVLSSIYSETMEGKEVYSMIHRGEKRDLVEYLDAYLKLMNTGSSNENTNTNTTNNTNTVTNEAVNSNESTQTSANVTSNEVVNNNTNQTQTNN